MKSIYNDGTYLSHNPSWHAEDASFKAKKINALLSRNNIQVETIAEIGCGTGEILVQLESMLPAVKKLTGYDISKDAIDIAIKKETQKIKFENKDITQEGEKLFYDLQLVIDTIEHIENYFEFLKSIGGTSNYTIFHIPLDMCVWSLFREKMLIESKKRVGHIHNFTEDFIISILSDYGFETIDKIYTEPIFKASTIKQKIIRFSQIILYTINKRLCIKTLGGYSILVLTKNKLYKSEGYRLT
jgi:SAM-dependent methyltransferase